MKTYKESLDLCIGLSILFPVETISLSRKPGGVKSPYLHLVIDEKFVKPVELALKAAGLDVFYKPSLTRSLFINFALDDTYPKWEGTEEPRIRVYTPRRYQKPFL